MMLPRLALAVAAAAMWGPYAVAQDRSASPPRVRASATGCRADAALEAHDRPPSAAAALPYGAGRWCARGPGDSVRVKVEFAPIDSEIDEPVIRRLVVIDRGRQTPAVDGLAVAFHSDDLEAADADGDGLRELVLRFSLMRGTTHANVVWRAIPVTRRYRADPTPTLARSRRTVGGGRGGCGGGEAAWATPPSRTPPTRPFLA